MDACLATQQKGFKVSDEIFFVCCCKGKRFSTVFRVFRNLKSVSIARHPIERPRHFVPGSTRFFLGSLYGLLPPSATTHDGPPMMPPPPLPPPRPRRPGCSAARAAAFGALLASLREALKKYSKTFANTTVDRRCRDAAVSCYFFQREPQPKAQTAPATCRDASHCFHGLLPPDCGIGPPSIHGRRFRADDPRPP